MFVEVMKAVILGLFLLFVVIRLIRPAFDSSGQMRSWTLTFMQISAVAIFCTVFLDTLQDAGRPPTPVGVSIPTSRPTISKVAAGKQPAATGSFSRAVLKEKYAILYAVFGMFSLLYLLSHKNEKMTNMAVRVIMAVRGKFNPTPYEDPIEQMMVDNLLRYSESVYHQEWFLRALMAKQGKMDTKNNPEVSGVSQIQPMEDDH